MAGLQRSNPHLQAVEPEKYPLQLDIKAPNLHLLDFVHYGIQVSMTKSEVQSVMQIGLNGLLSAYLLFS